MCNRIRDKEFNSNPAGGKVRRNDVCALLFRSGVNKYTDKNGWSINSEEMQNYLNQHGMKVGITLTKPRLLKPRGGQHQQTKRVKVWIISVLEKPLAHSSSIGSDFKKCIQIMKDSYPSYKSVLNAQYYRNNDTHKNRELNKMKRTSRNSGISSNTTTTKRKQNDIVTTLNNEPPPLQHNRVSLESGALENIQLDESPSVVPDNYVPAFAAPQHNHVSLEYSAPAFFTIPPMINVENTIDSFFAGPTLITPTTSSASCAPLLPTTASLSLPMTQ